jgi:hypothetical protein
MAWTYELNTSELTAMPRHFCLRELIAAAELEAQKLGNVVCWIEVNGVKLSEANEEQYSGTSISEIKNFKAGGSSEHTILVDTIHSLCQLLPHYENSAVELSNKMRTDGLSSEVVAQIAYLVGDIQLFNDSIIRLQNFGLADPGVWQQALGAINRTVAELLQAFEQKDQVLLADLLEYELTQCFNTWQDVLNNCGKKLANNTMAGTEDTRLGEGTSIAGV